MPRFSSMHRSLESGLFINVAVNVKNRFKTTHQNDLKVYISLITIKTITSNKITIYLVKKCIAA